MKTLVIANCHGEGIQQCLQGYSQDRRDQVDIVNALSATVDEVSEDRLAPYDLIIAQDVRLNRKEFWNAVNKFSNVIRFPFLVFGGLTPDHSTLPPLPGKSGNPNGNVSRIAAAACHRGLTPEQAQALYNPEFVALMGYESGFDTQRAAFVKMLSNYTPRAEFLFESWQAQDVYFHTSNHPKLWVVEDVLRDILEAHDIPTPHYKISNILADPLAQRGILPNLNHPAARNRIDRQDQVFKFGTQIVDLEGAIARTYRLYKASQGQCGVSDQDLARFDTAYAAYSNRTPEPLTNPYKSRPAHCYWSRAVARPASGDVRPGVHLHPVIARETRVATAGSCFAQHVARAMVKDGLTYYVAENAPDDMPEDIAADQGYGLFSARYGNIYSTRQLLQLIQRAYGRFTPIENAWPKNGGYVDPFRPNIGELFDSPQAVEAGRKAHLAKVREMFETLDVFVFTLGLTEGWFDRRDGAAYPVTPGAVTKGADPANFEFANHDYGDVKSDLIAFLGELAAINPQAQVVLTVSPVPLIATYSDTDALTATTYSKSVLRAAAGDVARDYSNVQYFPSYEIITGSYNRGAYFGEDLREIESRGVAHVMEVFRERLVIGSQQADSPGAEDDKATVDDQIRINFEADMAQQIQVVCDEELLVQEE
ncbi:GSCFA domain-containing protein [Sedimentitalea sp. XS_ASV28]|uniref:GSCFA domain-containing protein n=1 Tax=Sedimentitalea sp. XS_ASV28 TaxID=3241296 RepID=UPI0035120E8E